MGLMDILGQLLQSAQRGSRAGMGALSNMGGGYQDQTTFNPQSQFDGLAQMLQGEQRGPEGNPWSQPASDDSYFAATGATQDEMARAAASEQDLAMPGRGAWDFMRNAGSSSPGLAEALGEADWRNSREGMVSQQQLGMAQNNRRQMELMRSGEQTPLYELLENWTNEDEVQRLMGTDPGNAGLGLNRDPARSAAVWGAMGNSRKEQEAIADANWDRAVQAQSGLETAEQFAARTGRPFGGSTDVDPVQYAGDGESGVRLGDNAMRERQKRRAGRAELTDARDARQTDVRIRRQANYDKRQENKRGLVEGVMGDGGQEAYYRQGLFDKNPNVRASSKLALDDILRTRALDQENTRFSAAETNRSSEVTATARRRREDRDFTLDIKITEGLQDFRAANPNPTPKMIQDETERLRNLYGGLRSGASSNTASATATAVPLETRDAQNALGGNYDHIASVIKEHGQGESGGLLAAVANTVPWLDDTIGLMTGGITDIPSNFARLSGTSPPGWDAKRNLRSMVAKFVAMDGGEITSQNVGTMKSMMKDNMHSKAFQGLVNGTLSSGDKLADRYLKAMLEGRLLNLSVDQRSHLLSPTGL